MGQAIDLLLTQDQASLAKCTVEEAVQLTEVRAHSRQNAQHLIADYHLGQTAGRYLCDTVSELIEKPAHFDLALCWGGVFLKAPDDPLVAVQRLTLLADEVRLFPVVDATGEAPAFLPEIMTYCNQDNFGVELREVKPEGWTSGQAMLRLWRRDCKREA